MIRAIIRVGLILGVIALVTLAVFLTAYATVVTKVKAWVAIYAAQVFGIQPDLGKL